MKTVRLRVTMREVVPRVQRVLDVPRAITLDELHEVLQVAIGWTDSHLHQFRTDDAIYAVPLDDWEEDDEVDERGVRLSGLPTRFVYVYDLGDGWQHDVEVLGAGGDRAGCVGGQGACPPEDCGGVDGYADLLDALADPGHGEHEAMRTWVGDRLRPFDLEATTERVRDAVGAVPGSVRLLLGLLGDGVTLTPGGRLPRAVVRAVQAQRPSWYPLGGPPRSRRTCCPWPSCTTCCATSGWSGSPAACCARPRQRQTSSRPCGGCDPGSTHRSSPPWLPNAPSPWSPPAARCRSQRSPAKCTHSSDTAGAEPASP